MIRETDGAGNEEHEPDVLYRWAVSEPGVTHEIFSVDLTGVRAGSLVL